MSDGYHLSHKGFSSYCKLSKAAKKGRIYSPLPSDYFKKTSTEKSTYKITIELPKDLQESLDKGEAELMMPEEGLFVFAGKDIDEKLMQIEKKERTQLIHKNRDNVWRKE